MESYRFGFHRREAGKKGPQFIGDGIVEADGLLVQSYYGKQPDYASCQVLHRNTAHDGRYGPAGERKGTIPEVLQARQ